MTKKYSSKSGPAAVSDVDKKWQAEDDLRTLIRAREIRADKKRHAAAMECAESKLAAMKDITGS